MNQLDKDSWNNEKYLDVSDFQQWPQCEQNQNKFPEQSFGKSKILGRSFWKKCFFFLENKDLKFFFRACDFQEVLRINKDCLEAKLHQNR